MILRQTSKHSLSLRTLALHLLLWYAPNAKALECRLEGTKLDKPKFVCVCMARAWPGGVKSCCTAGDGHLHCVHLRVVKWGFASRSAAVCLCTCTCVRESKFYYLALQSGFTEAPSVTAVRYPTHIHTRARTGQGDRAWTMPNSNWVTGPTAGWNVFVCVHVPVCVCAHTQTQSLN